MTTRIPTTLISRAIFAASAGHAIIVVLSYMFNPCLSFNIVVHANQAAMGFGDSGSIAP
jgi:hypothetical protein